MDGFNRSYFRADLIWIEEEEYDLEDGEVNAYEWTTRELYAQPYTVEDDE